MGKIRVRILGEEALEKKQKQKSKQKAKEKKLVKGAKGGERLVAVGPSEEELAKLETEENKKTATTETQKKDEAQKFSDSDKFSASVVARKPSERKPKHTRSKNYQAVAKMVDKTKKYTLSEALEVVSKIKRAKFDETVELHINTVEKGISGNVTLPHGTGKKTRVAIASDELIAKVEKGKVDFDVLLAEPTFMPKLAKVAKFLGPRGLMPNPKNGTISNDPKNLAKKYEGGQVSFKTEAKSPIMHLTVGKVSFGQKKLSDNIKAMLEAIKKEKIRKITLKSTMSPGIKITLP